MSAASTLEYLKREAHEADETVIRLERKLERAQADVAMVEEQIANAKLEAQRLHDEAFLVGNEPIEGTVVENTSGIVNAGTAEARG